MPVSRFHRRSAAGPILVLFLLGGGDLLAHDIFVMNSNHTDYNWNATAAQYDAAMLAEMDYYLAQIDATAGNPPAEQARYTADNWWWLWLYEKNRPPAQFQKLIDAIDSGHITVPLNPFVTLYGALPTEAAIRAGYYPGQMTRRHGIEFRLAEDMENQTNPWGLVSLWAGSGTRYTWKGVCGCVSGAPRRVDEELFRWEGPDGKTLLFKWYELLGDNQDWGGYSEARNNLSGPADLSSAISLGQSRMPGISVTGLFGAGWDDVDWQTSAVVDAVQAFNALGGADQAVVSNGIDFFQALEARGEAAGLPILRGGWGNDWDMWPASLAEPTAAVRRAFERLRLAEALAVLVQQHDPTFWGPVRDSLEAGLVSAWKYFEHSWGHVSGGPSISQIQQDKEAWASDLVSAVDDAIAEADVAVAGLLTTPDEDRVLVFNPLGFVRTDAVDLPAPGPGPFQVQDVMSGATMASQLVLRDGSSYVRFEAIDVPGLGYRVFRLLPEAPPSQPDAATVDTVQRKIESDLHRVVLGNTGEIVEATHLLPSGSVALAGPGGLNHFGSGTVLQAVAENVGPVSATLRVDLSGPARSVRVTLYRSVDRIDIENHLLQNISGLNRYSFRTALGGSQIRFEELGAIARPGLVAAGGDFLQGTRASRMTLNHFVDFALPGYHLVISNQDAYAMQVNDSTDSAFDLTGDAIHVIATEPAPPDGILGQGGYTSFLHRFALRGIPEAFDGAEAMRTALAHQNPLHPVLLPRNQTGPITSATGVLAAIDDDSAVVTAFKPAEEPGAGVVLRLWELRGQAASIGLLVSPLAATAARATSLVEVDGKLAPMFGGVVSASLQANEIGTWRVAGFRSLPVEVTEDAGSGGVRLDWGSGAAPFVVRRSVMPAAPGTWPELTAPGGTLASSFIDAGVLDDGVNYFYVVQETH